MTEDLLPPWADAAEHDNVRITRIRPVLTAPHRPRLVVVKVETSQPGLYGLGCATMQSRASLVASAVADFLHPLLVGRDVADITDIHQVATLSSYWRDSAVLNHAVAGVDAALWDIAGKIAGLPVYRLFGGRVRAGVATYSHATGGSPAEVLDHAEATLAAGYRHIRCQVGVAGQSSYGYGTAGRHGHRGGLWEPAAYRRSTLEMFDHLRERLGDEVELLHDAHERLSPADAVRFAADLDPYRLFFLEDPVAPHEVEHLARLRTHASTPIAMSELFTSPAQWLPVVQRRLVDYVRVNVAAIGGPTVARRLSAVCAAFGVRTAFHGPADVSAVGQAANLHLNVAHPEFGIQEHQSFPETVDEVFPGVPRAEGGELHVTDAPGWGVDLDEAAAARYPHPPDPRQGAWAPVRRPDGTVVLP